jgi:2'-5' RNA ligase
VPRSTLPRLFTAIWPPQPVVAELTGVLDADARWPLDGWRPIPSRRWHLTLCFHGEADPGVLARRLDSALDPGAGLGAGSGMAPAPWLRLAGAVSFARVIAARVRTAGPEHDAALAALVTAAGADPGGHRPHVTLARTARRCDTPPRGGPPAGFVGSWWRPEEICLVRSEMVSGAPRYTVLHRVALHVDHVSTAMPISRPIE